MKKILCLFLVALAAGCADRPATTNSLAWTNNCEKHFSYDSRELNNCKDRVAQHETVRDHAGQVVVNPENAINETEIETHKSRD